MLVFGETTYKGMAEYWTKAEGEGEIAKFMNAIQKVVLLIDTQNRRLEQYDNRTRRCC